MSSHTRFCRGIGPSALPDPGGFIVPTCNAPTLGDDGVLRTEGNTNIANCAANYPPIHSIQAGDDLNQAALDLSCVASVGTEDVGLCYVSPPSRG